MSNPTQTDLRNRFHYNPDTGVFTYKVRAGSVNAGSTARHVDKDGYNSIRFNRRMFGAHRLAWLYVHGVMPDMVDHIDRNRLNNAIANLRLCNKAENAINSKLRSDNTSGYRGVYYCRHKDRYKAEIHVHGRKICLGYHRTKDAAATAYRLAAEKHFGEFYSPE